MRSFLGGASDAANLLKPALEQRASPSIGATTWAEHKSTSSKDPRLPGGDEPSENAPA